MPKSKVGLEPTELASDEPDAAWTEAMASIDRDNGEYLSLYMRPAEMEALYRRLKLYYEHGIWSTGTVEVP